MDESTHRDDAATLPGSVLVAGCGFIVTAAAWGLFGFLEGEFTSTSSSTLFFIVALTHGLIGVTILARRPIAIPVGIVMAIVGLVIAVIKPQFVLVFTNLIILTLLVLARNDIAGRTRSSQTAR